VLAARLSEDPDFRVLLLEAGGRPLDPALHVPIGLMRLNYGRHSWQYEADPDESRGGLREIWPAGMKLGGTSAINGMLWGRGARADYDAWAEHGLAAWAYDDVLKYFTASERFHGAGTSRGESGPVSVIPAQCAEPLASEFLQSALARGFAANPDPNDGRNLGVAPVQVARSPRRRQSTYAAYLSGARRRANLRVSTHAHVTRILVHGSRAAGVAYLKRGRLHLAYCSGEVLVSAGAIGSPAVLMRSGIGPADHLAGYSIPVVADLGGVGSNLRNHPVMALVFEVTRQTLNSQRSPWHLLAEIGRYAAGRGGLLTTAPSHVMACGTFDGTNPAFSIAFGSYGIQSSASGSGHSGRPMRKNAITLRVLLFDSESRGAVRLRSAEPRDKPSISYSALGGSDVERMTRACREARSIMQSPPISRYVVGEITPGDDVQGDADWEACLRRLTGAGRHYGGTCAMGTDAQSVVDADLRVRGLANVRVADASVMPGLPSSGLFGPTVMIAERAAELVAAARR
jgi:choline dehydrogenase